MCGMKKKEICRAATSFVFVALLAATAAAQKPEPRYKELPNFHRVSATLYRGGQPREGGLQRLAELGVKTIINLRERDENAGAEEREAQALGLRYYNIPMERSGAPTDEQIARVFEILDSKEDQPVFLHCHRGSDRTGAVIAVYRITHEGWTGERALKEAEQYGMYPWQRAKKSYIRDYIKRHAAPVAPGGASPKNDAAPAKPTREARASRANREPLRRAPSTFEPA